MKFTIRIICLVYIYILLVSHFANCSYYIQNSIKGKITQNKNNLNQDSSIKGKITQNKNNLNQDSSIKGKITQNKNNLNQDRNYKNIILSNINNLNADTVHSQVKANTITAAPFSLILNNVKNFFGNCPKLSTAAPSKECKKKIAEADAKVQELRGKDIGTVAKYFATEIQTVDDYWYKYYILANVALRGKLVKGKAEHWVYSPDKKTIENSHYNLLDEDTKRNFETLMKKDSEFFKKIAICKRQTLAELVKKKDDKNIKFKEWTGPEERSTVEIRDFDHNIKFIESLKGLSFFQKISTNFPKGVIHHFHWSAGLTSGTVDKAVKNYVNAPNTNRVLIRVNISSKDRSAGAQTYKSTGTRPKTYLKLLAPKFYIINNFTAAAAAYKKDDPRVKYLVNNFVDKEDGRCVAFEESKVKEEVFGDKQKDDFYFALLKHCSGSILYSTTQNLKLFEKDKELKNKIQKLDPEFKIFLDGESNILKTNQQLMENYLPDSYQKIIMNVKENISAAVWYLFENIFDMLAGVFDQVDIFKELDKAISKAWKDQKVLGVEYRQKNKNVDIIVSDLKSSNILYAFQAPAIKLRNSKINRITSLIPDAASIKKKLSPEDQAKVTGEKNKMDLSKVSAKAIAKAKEEIFNENMPDQHNYVGFDFIGYEDDPFNGARNFFPVALQKVLKNHETKDLGHASNHSNQDRFTPVFELSKKMKLQLHAGETAYLPDYPVDDNFLNKFYVNDHLFNAALLPNVDRIGHGFGVARNGLIQAIFALKSISLEVCPISNETLRYYDVYEHPFPQMLRKGLKMGVSPDDPGFFGYEGVAHDWFKLMMETDLKPSEYFLLVKNSIEKAGDKMFRTEGKAATPASLKTAKMNKIKQASIEVLQFFTNLSCKEPDAKLLQLKPDETKSRKQLKQKTDQHFKALIQKNYNDIDVMTSVYDLKNVNKRMAGIKGLNLMKGAVVDLAKVMVKSKVDNKIQLVKQAGKDYNKEQPTNQQKKQPPKKN